MCEAYFNCNDFYFYRLRSTCNNAKNERETRSKHSMEQLAKDNMNHHLYFRLIIYRFLIRSGNFDRFLSHINA